MRGYIVPKGMDFEAMALKYFLIKNDKKLNEVTSKLKLVVSDLLKMQTSSEYKDDKYYPLHSKILRKKTSLGERYHDFIEALKQEGIIEVMLNEEGKETYFPGTRSKAYRVVNPDQEFIMGEINFEKHTTHVKETHQPIPEYLSKWFNPNLTIDTELAHQKIIKLELDPKHILQVNMIRDGIFNLSRDASGYRVHSPLTSLKSELRKYLRYNNQPLVGIDLKTSQPFILASLILNPEYYKETPSSLFNDFFARETYLLKKGLPSLSSSLDSNYNNLINYIYPSLSDPLLNNPIPLPNVSESVSVQGKEHKRRRKGDSDYRAIKQEVLKLLDSEDVKEFRRIVFEGDIYERIAELAGLKDRDEAKKAFYEMFFGRLKNDLVSSFSLTRIKNLFPNVFKVIRLYKLKSNAFGWQNSDKPHAGLALMLQFLESYIFIDIITRYISEERPDVPIITIHDSILTTPENVGYVKKRMEEIIESLTGFKPVLKHDLFGNQLSEKVDKSRKGGFAYPMIFD